MNAIMLIISCASFVVALLSLLRVSHVKARLCEISALSYESLLEVRRAVESLDRQEASLNLRNKLERSIRRIMIFTEDEGLVSQSILWFVENAIPEDRPYLSRALKYRCVPGKRNREYARMIVEKTDVKV